MAGSNSPYRRLMAAITTAATAGGHQHADVELLHGIHVVHQPSHEVAAAQLDEARRSQRLDGGVEPGAHGGQDAEHGAVGRVALEVAEPGARDGQHPHARDSQRQLRHARRDGGLRDEVGREAHEGHVRADGHDAQQDAQCQPRPLGQHQSESPPQLAHAGHPVTGPSVSPGPACPSESAATSACASTRRA